MSEICKVVVFSGAGISRESGLRTFRGENGMWNGFRIESVCSARAWEINPENVLWFYDERRREVRNTEPNDAHYAIAELARTEGFTVTVVTQNIDDLHERAGSASVLHLHGELMKKRSDRVDADGATVSCHGDIDLGDLAPDGGQYRPHVVMFHENLPAATFEAAATATAEADVLIVVGTTLMVYPASLIATHTGASRVFVIDPEPPSASLLESDGREVILIAKPATVGIAEVVSLLKKSGSGPSSRHPI